MFRNTKINISSKKPPKQDIHSESKLIENKTSDDHIIATTTAEHIKEPHVLPPAPPMAGVEKKKNTKKFMLSYKIYQPKALVENWTGSRHSLTKGDVGMSSSAVKADITSPVPSRVTTPSSSPLMHSRRRSLDAQSFTDFSSLFPSFHHHLKSTNIGPTFSGIHKYKDLIQSLYQDLVQLNTSIESHLTAVSAAGTAAKGTVELSEENKSVQDELPDRLSNNIGLPKNASAQQIETTLKHEIGKIHEFVEKCEQEKSTLVDEIETYKHEFVRTLHENKEKEFYLQSRINELIGDNESLRKHLENICFAGTQRKLTAGSSDDTGSGLIIPASEISMPSLISKRVTFVDLKDPTDTTDDLTNTEKTLSKATASDFSLSSRKLTTNIRDLCLSKLLDTTASGGANHLRSSSVSLGTTSKKGIIRSKDTVSDFTSRHLKRSVSHQDLDILKRENHELNRKLFLQEKEVTEWKGKYTELDTKYSELLVENGKLLDELIMANRKLAVIVEERSKLERNVRALDIRADKLIDSHDKKQKEWDNQVKELESMCEQKDNLLMFARSKADNEIQQLKKVCNEYKHKTNELFQKINQISSMLKMAHSKLTDMNRHYKEDKTRWQSKFKELSEELESYHVKISKYEKSIVRLTVTNRSLKKLLNLKAAKMQWENHGGEKRMRIATRAFSCDCNLVINPSKLNGQLYGNVGKKAISTSNIRHFKSKSSGILHSSNLKSFAQCLDGLTTNDDSLESLPILQFHRYALKLKQAANQSLREQLETMKIELNRTETNEIQELMGKYAKKKNSLDLLQKNYESDKNSWNLEKYHLEQNIKKLEDSLNSINRKAKGDKWKNNNALEKIQFLEKRSQLEETWNVERRELKHQINTANQTIKGLNHEIFDLNQNLQTRSYEWTRNYDTERLSWECERLRLNNEINQLANKCENIQGTSERTIESMKISFEAVKEKNAALNTLILRLQGKSGGASGKVKKKLGTFLSDLNIFKSVMSDNAKSRHNGDHRIDATKSPVYVGSTTAFSSCNDIAWDQQKEDMESVLKKISNMTNTILAQTSSARLGDGKEAMTISRSMEPLIPGENLFLSKQVLPPPYDTACAVTEEPTMTKTSIRNGFYDDDKQLRVSMTIRGVTGNKCRDDQRVFHPKNDGLRSLSSSFTESMQSSSTTASMMGVSGQLFCNPLLSTNHLNHTFRDVVDLPRNEGISNSLMFLHSQHLNIKPSPVGQIRAATLPPLNRSKEDRSEMSRFKISNLVVNESRHPRLKGNTNLNHSARTIEKSANGLPPLAKTLTNIRSSPITKEKIKIIQTGSAREKTHNLPRLKEPVINNINGHDVFSNLLQQPHSVSPNCDQHPRSSRIRSTDQPKIDSDSVNVTNQHKCSTEISHRRNNLTIDENVAENNILPIPPVKQHSKFSRIDKPPFNFFKLLEAASSGITATCVNGSQPVTSIKARSASLSGNSLSAKPIAIVKGQKI